MDFVTARIKRGTVTSLAMSNPPPPPPPRPREFKAQRQPSFESHIAFPPQLASSHPASNLVCMSFGLDSPFSRLDNFRVLEATKTDLKNYLATVCEKGKDAIERGKAAALATQTLGESLNPLSGSNGGCLMGRTRKHAAALPDEAALLETLRGASAMFEQLGTLQLELMQHIQLKLMNPLQEFHTQLGEDAQLSRLEKDMRAAQQQLEGARIRQVNARAVAHAAAEAMFSTGKKSGRMHNAANALGSAALRAKQASADVAQSRILAESSRFEVARHVNVLSGRRNILLRRSLLATMNATADFAFKCNVMLCSVENRSMRDDCEGHLVRAVSRLQHEEDIWNGSRKLLEQQLTARTPDHAPSKVTVEMRKPRLQLDSQPSKSQPAVSHEGYLFCFSRGVLGGGTWIRSWFRIRGEWLVRVDDVDPAASARSTEVQRYLSDGLAEEGLVNLKVSHVREAARVPTAQSAKAGLGKAASTLGGMLGRGIRDRLVSNSSSGVPAGIDSRDREAHQDNNRAAQIVRAHVPSGACCFFDVVSSDGVVFFFGAHSRDEMEWYVRDVSCLLFLCIGYIRMSFLHSSSLLNFFSINLSKHCGISPPTTAFQFQAG